VRKLKAKRGGVPNGFFLKTWWDGVGGGKKRQKKVRTRRQDNNWRQHLLRDKILKGNDG
jgi:hypothetical protein